MALSPVPIGEVFADKYRVDRILGEGGMGIVVAAHHLELDQPVAIKFLLDDVASHEEGAERFRREARAAAKIQSDHVVRVLDVGVLDGGERYMVMEYMEGRDLCEEIAERKTFPIGVAAGFILEALDAITHAHQVGIVHRDLKPANLFLATRPDGSQRIKVLDFGISKSLGGASTSELSLTKTSAWIGSPLYMAPEQMQSARDVDHRADIWSMGAILYELIAGHPPYQAESLPQLCNMLITTDPVPIQAIVPSVPDGLAHVIMGCLVRDRDARIQTASELSLALVNYATSITGSALRQSLMDRTELGAASSYVNPSQVMPSQATPSQAGPSQLVMSGGTPSLAGPPMEGGVSPATVSSATNAAWGGTDEGKRKSGGKLGLAIAALLGAGIVGFFVMSGGAEAPAPDAQAAPVVATHQPEQPADNADEPDGGKNEDPEPEDDAAASAAPVPDAGEPVAPAPQVAAPQAAAPKAVSTPRPVKNPAPQPKPAPAPATDGGISDFGGRR